MIIFRMVLEWSPQDGALYAWGAPLQATTFWYSKFFLFRRQNSLWRLLLPEVGATYKVWDQRWEMQWVMTFKQIPLVGSDRLTMNWYELMKLIEADVPKKVVDSHIFRSIQKPWFGVFMLGDSTSIMSARVEWTLLKWTHFFPTQLQVSWVPRLVAPSPKLPLVRIGTAAAGGGEPEAEAPLEIWTNIDPWSTNFCWVFLMF